MSTELGYPKSFLGVFLRFLTKTEYPVNLIQKSFSGKLTDLFKLYSLNLCVIAFICIPIVLFSESLINYKSHALDDSLSFEFLLFGVLVAPFLEEVIFRLFLRYSPLNLAINILLINLIILAIFIKITTDLLLNFILVVATLVLPLIVYIVAEKYISQKSADSFYIKNIRWMFYLSTIVFAAIHLDNFQGLEGSWIIMPLLVLPQFMAGLFLGFIRIYYGIFWSILFHGFYNFSLLLGLFTETTYSKNIWVTYLVLLYCLVILIICIKVTLNLIKEWRQEKKQLKS